MVLAITPNRLWRYVLEDERELPEEKQTQWVLRTLTSAEREKVDDSFASRGADGVDFRTGRYFRQALRLALHDVEGVGLEKVKLDENGDPMRDDAGELVVEHVPFAYRELSAIGGKRTRRVKDEYLDLIPSDVAQELAQAVLDGNRLTEDEAKN